MKFWNAHSFCSVLGMMFLCCVSVWARQRLWPYPPAPLCLPCPRISILPVHRAGAVFYQLLCLHRCRQCRLGLQNWMWLYLEGGLLATPLFGGNKVPLESSGAEPSLLLSGMLNKGLKKQGGRNLSKDKEIKSLGLL